MKAASSVIAVFLVMPIWYYLVHWLLVHSGAGDLQMFLFWVYMPFGVFTRLLDRLVEIEGKLP
jgi:hypothetical protein